MKNRKSVFARGIAYVALTAGLAAPSLVIANESQKAGFINGGANADLASDSRRLRAEYQEFGGAEARAAMVDIQNRLPAGFAMGKGASSYLPGNLASLAPAAETAGAGRHITLYPIEYNGVPLASGSDYLTV